MERFWILAILALVLGVFIKAGAARADAASPGAKAAARQKKAGWPGGRSRRKELDPAYYESVTRKAAQNAAPYAAEAARAGDCSALDGFSLARGRDAEGAETTYGLFDAARSSRYASRQPAEENLSLSWAEGDAEGLNILFASPGGQAYRIRAADFRFKRTGECFARGEGDALLLTFGRGTADECEYRFQYDAEADTLSVRARAGMDYIVRGVRLMAERV